MAEICNLITVQKVSIRKMVTTREKEQFHWKSGIRAEEDKEDSERN